MQKIALFALALSLVSLAAPAAPSHDKAYRRAEALLARLKAHPPKKINALAAPLLNFSSSPSVPTQGKDLTWVIQFDNPFSNRDLSIDLTLNGAPVTNIQSPYKGMFVVDLGVQNTAGAANLVATLFADDTSTHTDIRTAVSTLDTAVKRLTSQINAERNPVNRANLEEQRSEDVAMKNELLTELKAYRYNLGVQTQAFTVKPDSSSTTLPTITSISPVTGDVRGGTVVTIAGTNFSSAASVLFGGIASPSVTFLSSSSIQAVTPDFGAATGAKDVELRFGSNGNVTNVVSPGAFFAQNATSGSNQNPVAIAAGSTKIHLGSSTTLDGSESYGGAGAGAFYYEWKLISAPSTSQYAIGQVLSNSMAFTMTPSAPGTYVIQLVVDNYFGPHFPSAPSIAVIQVDGSPAPAAGQIVVSQGASGTSQVIANDPIPGDSVTYSISAAPLHGTASIDSNGLVTYSPANSYLGSDSLVAVVTTQAGLFGSVVIPVSVYPQNHAPVASAPAITVDPSGAGTSQISASDQDGWQTLSYAILTAPTLGSATVSSGGLVSYSAPIHTAGTDSLVVRVSDNGFPVRYADVTIAVNLPNHPPVASAPPITVKPGVAGTSQVNGYDRDLNQTVSYSITTLPANGTATLSSSGLVTYTPNDGYTGTDSLVVTVVDNGSPQLSTNVTIPVMVSNLNPPSLPSVYGFSTFFGNAPFQLGLGFKPSNPEMITDGNGGVASVLWDFGDGTRELSGDRQYAGIGHNYVEAGTYQAVLIVTDLAGLTSSISFPVVVKPLEIPVVRVSMTPSTGGTAPLNVTLDASASTYSGPITAYRWQFCGVNPETITTQPTITHAFTAGCSVRVRAVAGDSSANGQATIFVPVNATAGSPPSSQFTITPFREVVPGVPLTFDGQRSIDGNLGGSITNYNWSFNDSTCSPPCTATGQVANHTYNNYGGWYPSLTVTNSLGFTNPSGVQVLVVHPGTHGPRSIATASGVKGVAPFTVTFNSTQSYGFYDASIQSVSHFYGDGPTPGTGPISTHTYTTPGFYTMDSRVYDSNGNSADAFINIQVTSTAAELESTRDEVPADPDRENQRQMLSGACNAGDGAACFGLSQMYAEDGEPFAASQLKMKACSLGFAPACAR